MTHPLIERAAERYDRIEELTRQGLPASLIAEMLKCTTRTVERARAARGCAQPPSVPMSEEELTRARQLLDDGCSYNEVARTIRRSPRVIKARFPGYGWTPEESAEYAIFCRWYGQMNNRPVVA